MVAALTSTVCISGIGNPALLLPDIPRADPPAAHRLGLGAEAAQVVESDGRVRPGQVHVGVEVAQHTVGQRGPAGREAALWRL